MVRENAGKGEARFGTVLEAVAAAIEIIALKEISATVTQIGGRTTQGDLVAGRGVGRDPILAHPSIKGQLSQRQVEAALPMIKDALSKHLAIMLRVQARVIAGKDADAIARAKTMIARISAKINFYLTICRRFNHSSYIVRI